jgi:hypothetical protein
MNKSKQCYFSLASILLLVCTLSVSVSAQEELDISGIPVKVIREFYSSFKTEFVEVVIPTDQYSKDNLIKIWKYYCEKYPVKSIKLDLRIFTSDTYDYNKQFDMSSGNGNTRIVNGVRLERRSYEAYFERMGDGAAASGGDNELLIYCPDPAKPKEKIRVVLAGKDPYIQ